MLGPVLRDPQLPALWEAVTALKDWRDKLAAPPAAAGSSSGSAASAAGGGGGAAASGKEFGADLDFHFADVCLPADQAAELLCGGGGGGGGGRQGSGGAAAGGLSYGKYDSEPSPAELMQMVAAAGGGGGDAAVGGGGDGGGGSRQGAYTLYDDDDDDGENLDGKKMKDVSWRNIDGGYDLEKRPDQEPYIRVTG